MIVPMKKVSLVLLENERKEALKSLRKLGVVQLEEVHGSSEELQALKDKNNKILKALSFLTEAADKKSLKNQKALETAKAAELAEKVVALEDRKKTCQDRSTADANELDRLTGWGEVEPEKIAELAEKGIYLSLYEIPSNKYRNIGKETKTLLVNADKSKTRFLLLSEDKEKASERPADLPPEAFQVLLPRCSTAELKKSVAENKAEIAKIEGEIAFNAVYIDALKKALPVYNKEIELENFASGMGRESANLEEGEAAPKVPLAWITGFIPAEDLAKLQGAAKKNGWAIASKDPDDEEFVPTKLKNNKVTEIIYPLMDFLDVTPGYHEFDISGWFLLFFCIFFGMIFADAGYGALIALLGLGLLAKSKKGKKALPVLVTVLGCCTAIWGIMTCSWFGMPTEMLPKELVGLSFAPVSAAKVGKALADKNQQIFCFVLALIQLSIAHIKCTIADRKSLKCIGDFGSLLQLWGTFYVVLSMVVADGKYYIFPLVDTGENVNMFGWMAPHYFPTCAIGLLAFGFMLNFIFANYNGSVGKSILESLKNIISVFLGIVNVFSDIVSYIRLWAVALAGAAISGTVNQMAGPMFGKLTIMIFGVILLLFGHGLNMMLNLLSVIVHGVRLNTLEFSQHLGMNWSGSKFRPFSE